MYDTPAVAFFDVDGTLIWHDPDANAAQNVAHAQVTPGVKRAFERLHARGNLSFICTGRPRNLINQGLLDLNPTGLITSSGACLFLEGRKVFERTIGLDLLHATVDWLMEEGIEVLFEGTDCFAALLPNGGVYTDIPGALSVHSWEELCAATDLRFSKFSYAGDMIERVEQMGEPLRSHYTFYNLGLGAGEAGPVGIDKAFGIAKALEQLNHSAKNTYAFGDSENDLPMLRAVETSIAMGNAMDVVKAQADYVTDSAAHDGVATGLAHFGLI